jgi:hypothetical protein
MLTRRSLFGAIFLPVSPAQATKSRIDFPAETWKRWYYQYHALWQELVWKTRGLPDPKRVDLRILYQRAKQEGYESARAWLQYLESCRKNPNAADKI